MNGDFPRSDAFENTDGLGVGQTVGGVAIDGKDFITWRKEMKMKPVEAHQNLGVQRPKMYFPECSASNNASNNECHLKKSWENCNILYC